MNIPKTVHSSC